MLTSNRDFAVWSKPEVNAATHHAEIAVVLANEVPREVADHTNVTSDANFEAAAELPNRSYIIVLDHSIGEPLQRLVFVTPLLREKKYLTSAPPPPVESPFKSRSLLVGPVFM